MRNKENILKDIKACLCGECTSILTCSHHDDRSDCAMNLYNELEALVNQEQPKDDRWIPCSERLIDADALKERFRNGESDSKEEKLWNHTVRRMIEEQPTAYNVDKVIEQIEDHSLIGYVPVGVATTFVRKGGIENRT